MEARTTIRSVWLVHATASALVGVLLLVRALPIDWDTPTNLEYQEGWGSLAVAICVLAVLVGSTEGVLWARGVRVGALLTCLIGAAFAFAGAGFYLDRPFANGGDVWTAGREHVVMSQLVWWWYSAAQTSVVLAWLALPAQRHLQAASARTDVSLRRGPG
jgi:hypothetical protein